MGYGRPRLEGKMVNGRERKKSNFPFFSWKINILIASNLFLFINPDRTENKERKKISLISNLNLEMTRN